jgi:hypothetical protein
MRHNDIPNNDKDKNKSSEAQKKSNEASNIQTAKEQLSDEIVSARAPSLQIFATTNDFKLNSGKLLDQHAPLFGRSRALGKLVYDPNPDSDIAIALKHAASPQEKDVDALLSMLEADPQLLLKTSNVVTPGGLEVRDVTLYECVLGASDLDLAKLIKPYFKEIKEIKNGEEEGDRQYERYRPYLEGIETQEPDDNLTWLFDIIKKSSLKDVAAELATGDAYDKSYQSPLRDAFNQFRAAKLDSKVRIMTKPRLHCNYQNLRHAYDMLYSEWNNLKVGNDNYDKNDLVAQQIIGFIHLLELPGYERCLFARGKVENAAAGKEIDKSDRSYKYKYGDGSFPDFDSSLMDSHVGVGFGSSVSIFAGREWGGFGGGVGCGVVYKTYVEQKLQTWRTYARAAETGDVSMRNLLR